MSLPEYEKPKLIPIRNHFGWDYGSGINATIQEVPGNFGVKDFDEKIRKIGQREYSLHTEYSHPRERRKFDNPIFDGLNSLKNGSDNGLPLLWFTDEWSKEFAKFIVRLIDGDRPPKIIEIHPPYRRYCGTIGDFLDRYSAFCDSISKNYPQTKIVIENRTGNHSDRKGNHYPENKPKNEFLISDDEDIKELLRELKLNKGKFELKLALDIPQLFAALKQEREWETEGLNQTQLDEVISAIKGLEENKELIAGIHVWGRNTKGVPHMGDLDSLFESKTLKEDFLNFIRDDFFNDGKQRYVVLEVHRKEPFILVVKDLMDYFDLSGQLE